MTPRRKNVPLRTGRFVILAHQTLHALHWDLMLEWDDSLKTWSLSREADQYGSKLEGTPLPDHRSLYLDYEGPISGDRGSVLRWDSGQFTLLGETPAGLLLEFQGQRLSGTYTLASRSR